MLQAAAPSYVLLTYNTLYTSFYPLCEQHHSTFVLARQAFFLGRNQSCPYLGFLALPLLSHLSVTWNDDILSSGSYQVYLLQKEQSQQYEEVSSLDINTPTSIPHLTISGPASGHHLRPFALPDATGRTVQLWQYLQRSNVVLFFYHGVDCTACTTILQELAAQRDAYFQEETAVLAIGPDQPAENQQLADRLGHPFPLLSDPPEQTVAQQELDTPSLVIADRWGEIWAAWAGGADHRLPSGQDILQWLVFIEAQCPECTMIEWTEQEEDS